MELYAGLDVSLKRTEICVVDGAGGIVWRGRTDTHPEMIADALCRWRVALVKVGLETGSTTPWLARGLRALGFPVVVMDARRAADALKGRPVKTDRADARALAEMLQTALALVALFDHPRPEGAFVGIRRRHGADHRQGQLPLAEVVADILAQHARHPAIIEHIVDDLERHADGIAIGEKRLHPLFGGIGDDAAHLGRGGKQRRRLAADHPRIDAFIGCQVMRRGQLQHLALGDGGGGVRQDAQHPQAAGFHHQLERPGKQIVPDQDRTRVVPQKIRRRPAAPGIAVVDHIVMQQRGGVDELHRRGQMDVTGPVIAAQPRRGEGQQRAQPLAARPDQMRGDLGDARRVLGRHALADQRVDRRHVVRQAGGQRVMRGGLGGIGHAPETPSTSGPAARYPNRMKEMIRSNDPVRMAFARTLLQGEQIEVFELDVHMSALEGSIGILPRRLMVADRDAFRARAVLRDNGLLDEG
jgi:hypothetical protein